jgi:nitric oxide reductase NorD protein
VAGSDYTRLGAPIRHLTASLARERSRVRLLFLLSDGKPNDEDEYEGRYGIEDTRQAVAEARLQGLAVFCLTIDREGPRYLPHMFGARGYAVAARVAELPRRLPEIYRTITS